MSEFLNGLNDAQREAAINTEGPVMVLAGAGSGKTRVLTYRIAYLLEQGTDPFGILALTFTNKAAKEMKERIARLIGGTRAFSLWMGTFHSVFARILRNEAETMGYPRNFTIYDTDDAKSLLKTITKEMNLDPKIYKPNIIYGRISKAKNNLISPEQYLNSTQLQKEDQSKGLPQTGFIYKAYVLRCRKAGAMDFDDLLYKTNELFQLHPDILTRYQEQFRYILVDEYQDTNFSQYSIIKSLASLFQNICVVGDDAQSIYSFRGANIQNILNFKNDYPTHNTYKLEQNYRSTQNIVNAANCVIANNKEQLEKNVWTENPVGDKIRVIKTHSDNEEGKFVAESIFETRQNFQAPFSDFSILYRTNAQSRAIEESLRKLNIPYKIYGGISFYQRKEIKDLMAYYRLAINFNDEEAFKRIINYPIRGIGKTTMDKIILCSNQYGVTMWETIKFPERFGLQVTKPTEKKLADFVIMLESFHSEMGVKNAFEIGSHIAKTSGIYKDLDADKTPEGVSRLDNIEELINGLKEFSESKQSSIPPEERTLPRFMEDVALLTDADNEKDEDREKVSLMTIHAAKGLEYPYVYIVGMEENLFPSQLAMNSRAELEEERRLFYVALTRAEKKATLTFARQRYRWGTLIHCEPSRFIDEIDPKFLAFDSQMARQMGVKRPSSQSVVAATKSKRSIPKGNFVRLKNVQSSQKAGGKSVFQKSTPSDDLKVGLNVEHVRFGKGVIEAIDGAGQNKKATINFETSGKKQLLLKFAKLKVVN